jgi:murein DD-endopeptidase MepM/ murein hydrolase activator NlpD
MFFFAKAENAALFGKFRFSFKNLTRGVGLALAGLASVAATAPAHAEDSQFSALFSAWEKMDGKDSDMIQTEQKVAIPSRQPVEQVALTSSFGVRNDPFNGRHRMHQGIDIPGAMGTPVYATADGIVARAEWVGGYGNLVQLTHGNGMETRYGHLSKLIVRANERVRRGQLIGLMGSTGRSTGSHLHYEVRIAGAAVNPMPYLEGTNYELALSEAQAHVAMGGPEARTSKDND